MIDIIVNFSKSQFGQHSSAITKTVENFHTFVFACAPDHMVVKEKWVKSSENQWSFLCKQSQFTTKSAKKKKHHQIA